MDITKLPVDSLYKFLAILGMTTVFMAIILPVGAYWHLQVRRNTVEAEVQKHKFKQEQLVDEISALEAEGVRYSDRSTKLFNEVQAIPEQLRVELSKEFKDAEELTNKQLEQLTNAGKRSMQLMKELHAFEAAEAPDRVAIKRVEQQLDGTITSLASEDMPKDVMDAIKAVVRALRLLRESDQLSNEPVPDEKLIAEKSKAAQDAADEAIALQEKAIDQRKLHSNERKAVLLGRATEGIIKSLNTHIEALRFSDRVHRSGKQLSLKVMEHKLAQIDVDAKVKETEILAGQNRVAIGLGAVGVFIGTCVAAVGIGWWYRIEKLALRKEVVAVQTVEVALVNAKTKLIDTPQVKVPTAKQEAQPDTERPGESDHL